MKNLEYPCRSIITDMDISLLSTTTDIEQLRAMALAMVRKVVDENHHLQLQKNAELIAKDQRIRLLEEALMLARQQRFGRKTEMLSGLQCQLFEEDTEADNGINPEAYFRHIFAVLPDWSSSRVDELLPWNVDLTSQ